MSESEDEGTEGLSAEAEAKAVAKAKEETVARVAAEAEAAEARKSEAASNANAKQAQVELAKAMEAVRAGGDTAKVKSEEAQELRAQLQQLERGQGGAYMHAVYRCVFPNFLGLDFLSVLI